MFNFFEEIFAPGRRHAAEERKRLELSRVDLGVGDPGRGPIDLASGKVVVRAPGSDGTSGTDGTSGDGRTDGEDAAEGDDRPGGDDPTDGGERADGGGRAPSANRGQAWEGAPRRVPGAASARTPDTDPVTGPGTHPGTEAPGGDAAEGGAGARP